MSCVPKHGSFPTPWTGSLGIIGAIDSEVETLEQSLDGALAISIGPVSMKAGLLCGLPVVLAKSGVGKVNAAATALALVSLGVSHVVNTGAAGGLSPELTIGSFVVATDCVHHDVDACNFGYELGQVPGMPVSFEADAILRRGMVHAISEASGCQVYEGRIVSGDSFVRDSVQRKRIADVFGAVCCDMESAAIAQVCVKSGVPYAVVRVVSDLADGSMPEQYDDFESQAAHASAQALMWFLDRTTAMDSPAGYATKEG